MDVEDDFDITIELDGDRRTLRLHGELDLATVAVLSDCLSDGRSFDTIVDLSDLTFMGAPGLRALVIAQKRSTREGWKLSVRGATGTVATTLAIPHLYEVLTVEP